MYVRLGRIVLMLKLILLKNNARNVKITTINTKKSKPSVISVKNIHLQITYNVLTNVQLTNIY